MNHGPGMRLRKADVEDVKAICCVLKHATFLSERYRSGEASSRITEECKNGLFWVAEVHGEIVSTMIIMRRDADIPGRGKCYEIPIIVTKPEHRLQGLARCLLRKAKDLADDITANIYAYAENDKSADLLKSEGFSLVPGCSNEQGHPKYERVNCAKPTA